MNGRENELEDHKWTRRGINWCKRNQLLHTLPCMNELHVDWCDECCMLSRRICGSRRPHDVKKNDGGEKGYNGAKEKMDGGPQRC